MASGLGERWYLLVDYNGRRGAENMAIDHALLGAARRTGATFLRLYRWAPPCLSLGRNEPALRRYDREAIARRGWHVVRRPTGGRAVWHEHETTYAIAAPLTRWGGVARSYHAIHALLARALRSLGADAQLAQRGGAPPGTAGPCFASTVGGEVIVGGRKLIGSAQVREGPAFLQHGSILLDGSQDTARLASLDGHAVIAATTLRTVLGRPVDFREVAAAVVSAAVEAWGPPTAPPPSLPTLDVAAYESDAWTWRR